MNRAVTRTLPPQQIAQRFARLAFAMNQHHFARVDYLDQPGDLIAIGVGRERVFFDGAFDFERSASDGHLARFGFGQRQQLPQTVLTIPSIQTGKLASSLERNCLSSSNATSCARPMAKAGINSLPRLSMTPATISINRNSSNSRGECIRSP